MAIALVNHTVITGLGTNGGTSPAIDTTGATLLVISVGYYAAATKTVSDSYSNTWTPLTAQENSGDDGNRLWYALNPVVGTGHTFTITGSGVYLSACIAAFRGVANVTPFDVQNGAINAASTTIASGSVTPSANNELVITGASGNANLSGTPTGTGMTLIDSNPYVASNQSSSGLAYAIQTTASAINPAWTLASSVACAATIATFKAAPTTQVQLISHAAVAGTAGSNVTTAAINTTGATLLVVAVASNAGVAVTSVSDLVGGLSNTWNQLTSYKPSTNTRITLFYSVPTHTGASHTFTSTNPTTTDAAVAVCAFLGTAASSPFDVQSGSAAEGTLTVQPGSITPAVNGEVLVTAVGSLGDTAATIAGGFLKTNYSQTVGGNAWGLAMGYMVQITAGAANPTWSVTTGSSLVAAIASFKPFVAAAGGVPNLPPALLFGLTA